MKKIISIFLLLAMVVSLCACSGPPGSKIRTKNAAISAVKKDSGTEMYVCMSFQLMGTERFYYRSASAVETPTGWTVTLKGTVTGKSNNQLIPMQTYGFIFVAEITFDGVITDRHVTKSFK